MATHDYVIANGTGAAVRQDLNDALAAIVSNNSGSSEPATTYAYQWWADTTANVLKIRNSANNAWITLRELDGTMLLEDGSASTPGLAFAGDVDTGIFRSAANTINFATAGAERLEIGSSAVVFNDSSNDVDFRVESNGQTHMLFVDAGKDAVGIATTPEAWEAGQFFALQIGKGGAVYGRAAGDEDRNGLTSNCYHASDGWKYIAASAHATRYDQSDGNHIWFTAGTGSADAAVSFSESARINTDGKLIVGHSSARTNWNDSGIEPKIVIEGAGDNDSAALCIVANSGTTSSDKRAGLLVLGRTRGTSNGANTVVVQDDALGVIEFKGNDGTSFTTGALIKAQADGSVGTDDMPGRLVFMTTADGAAVPTERMTIKANGQVGMGVTAPSAGLEINDPSSGDTYLRLSGLSSNTADANYAGIEFYNTDSSGIGPGVQAWIEARATGSTGAGGELVFGTYPGVSSPEGARGVERVRITGDSYLRLSSNASGIQFNGDTAAANALSDYEEGSWTPVFGSTGGAFTSITYSLQSGNYTKIGERVYFDCRVQITAHTRGTAAGGLLVAGLPYTVHSPQGIGGNVALSNIDIPDSVVNLAVECRENAAQFYAGLYTRDNTTFGNISPSHLTSGVCEVRASGMYYTNS